MELEFLSTMLLKTILLKTDLGIISSEYFSFFSCIDIVRFTIEK